MHFCGKLNNVAVYEYKFYQEQICVENTAVRKVFAVSYSANCCHGHFSELGVREGGCSGWTLPALPCEAS